MQGDRRKQQEIEREKEATAYSKIIDIQSYKLE